MLGDYILMLSNTTSVSSLKLTIRDLDLMINTHSVVCILAQHETERFYKEMGLQLWWHVNNSSLCPKEFRGMSCLVAQPFKSSLVAVFFKNLQDASFFGLSYQTELMQDLE